MHEGKPTEKQTHRGVIINLLSQVDENGQWNTIIERIEVRCNEAKGYSQSRI